VKDIPLTLYNQYLQENEFLCIVFIQSLGYYVSHNAMKRSNKEDKMNWKKYKICFKHTKGTYPFDYNWDYSIQEALNSKDAIKMAKSSYDRFIKSGRNYPPIKEVKFSAMQINN
jgi:hypothetical protein